MVNDLKPFTRSSALEFAVALSAFATVSAHAADPDWAGLNGSLFGNVSGSVSVDFDDIHQQQQFGPTLFRSGESADLNLDIIRYHTASVPDGGSYSTPFTWGTVATHSGADGELTFAAKASSSYSGSTHISATAVWSGTFINPFADTRSFQVVVGGVGLYTDGGSFSVSINGAPATGNRYANIPYPAYSLGNLAPGATAAVSFQLQYDDALQSGSDLTMSLAALAYASTPVAAVPEPGTAALFLAGLGAVGAAARRRIAPKP